MSLLGLRDRPVTWLWLAAVLLWVGVSQPATATGKGQYWRTAIGLAKQAGSVHAQSDGSFTVDFRLRLQNVGNEPLTQVQVFDPLRQILQPAQLIEVSSLEVSGALSEVNAHFDGMNDIKLLSGHEHLPAYGQAIIQFTVRFDPGEHHGPFFNQAVAKAKGKHTRRWVEDKSTDGDDPDPDTRSNRPKRNPKPADDKKPTPVKIPKGSLALGVSKQVIDIQQVGLHTFDVTFSSVIENLSQRKTVARVQMVDPLRGTFGPAEQFQVLGQPSVRGALQETNPNFDGRQDIELLSGRESLAAGERATVEFTVRVQTGDFDGYYVNQIETWGYVKQQLLEDWSDDGDDPDPDGDGNPDEPGENDPTKFRLPKLEIGLAKALTALTPRGGDRFEATFELLIENLSESLTAPNLQIRDNFAQTFSGATNLTLVGAPTIRGDLTALNPAFDGTSDIQLLDGTESLAPGESAIVTLTVAFNANGNSQFLNSASASSSIENTVIAQDLSDNGTVTDSNGNGRADDPGEDDPTPIPIPQDVIANIGVAKQLLRTEQIGPAQFSVSFELTIENLSNSADAPNIQLIDDLAATFAGTVDVVVTNRSLSGALTELNPGFDGVNEVRLLTGDQTLTAGASATVTIDATVTLDAPLATETFTNQAFGQSQSTPDGALISEDPSDDGNVTDTDGDGNANEAGENDPTPITLAPLRIGAAKSLVSVTPVGANQFDLSFEFVVQNLSDTQAAPNIQLTDDFAATFGDAAVVELLSGPSVSGGLTAANNNYDGLSDINLLSGTETLAPGESANIELNIRVSGVSGEFLNQAGLTAGDPNNPIAADLSDDGNTPDGNGNGNAADPDEDDPTPIRLPVLNGPVIGAANELLALTPQPNGDTFIVDLLVRVSNLGDLPATNVQLFDSLTDTFGGLPFTAEATAIDGALNELNPNYDGAADSNLLSGTQTLNPGDSATITVQVTIMPGDNLGPFANQVFAIATDGAGSGLTDPSDDGAVIDTDGDGVANEDGENDPTIINFPPTASLSIGAAKALTSVTPVAADRFVLSFSFLIQNLSISQAAPNVQLSDDLAATFGPSASVSVIGPVVVSGGLSGANASFDGVTDTNLLAGNETLAAGASASIGLEIEVSGVNGDFLNQAVLSSDDGSNVLATDLSDDGNQPDSNGNGSAGDPGEDDPTPIRLPALSGPIIGAANELVSITPLAGDTFVLELTVRVSNLGDLPATNVQVVDSFADTFGGLPFTAAISSISGALDGINPDFDGANQTNLLSGVQTLAPGAGASINLQITITPGDNLGPFSNQVFATATDDTGNLISEDPSDDGAVIDTDGDGVANEDGENDPTVFAFDPVELLNIGVAKALTQVTPTTSDTFSVELSFVLSNLSTTLDAPDIQLIDDLAATFGAAEVILNQPPVVSGALSDVNPNYNGVTDTALLSGNETLSAGGTATLTLVFDVSGVSGEFFNQAQLLSGPPNNPLASDLSDDGSVPDSNGNGNAGDPGEDDPTPINLPVLSGPVIGAANELSSLDQADPNNVVAVFTIRVENIGDLPASNVQLVDSFADTFGDLTFSAQIVSISGDLSGINNNFDGLADSRLLSGDETLAPGSAATIQVQVNFDPEGNLGPFSNQVIATSSDANGIISEDLSDEGAVVDSNGNGVANEAGENDPTVFALTGGGLAIGAAKNLVSVTEQSAGVFAVSFEFFISNLSSQDATNVALEDSLSSAFPGASIVIPSTPQISGDLSSVNPGFDGVSDINLLSGTESLPAGGNARLTLTALISGVSGRFENQARLTSNEGGVLTATDLSDNGQVVDSNGNGNAGDPGEDDPTPVILGVVADVLGVAKSASVSSQVTPGVFRTTIDLVLTNFGTTTLTALSLTDDLDTVFGDIELLEVGAVTSNSGLLVNPSFDGVSDVELLAPGNELVAGLSADLSFAVTFAPGDEPNSNVSAVNNSAEGRAMSPIGTTVTDTSTNGANPDPDGDNNPNNNSVPTPIIFLPEPLLGLAKSASTPVAQDNGSFDTTLTFVLQNLGDTPLTNVALQDNLAEIFGDSEFRITAAPQADIPGLAVNSSFDGVGNNNLLDAANSRLEIGGSGTVTLGINVIPAPDATQFDNLSTASGLSPSNELVSDTSTDGLDPDPNDDGVPDEDDPTPIVPPGAATASLGVAKQVIDTEVLGVDQFRVTFAVVIENLGGVTVSNVQVEEDLAAAFPAPATVSISVAPEISGALDALNPAFDGIDFTQLLSGSQSLGANESATLTFAVDVTLNGASGPFANQVTISGTDPDSNPLDDPSDDGDNPDPDGDGNPGGPGEDDPTPVSFPAALVGSVFLDEDLDGQFDEGEPRLSGWRVEVIDSDGNVIASTTTNGQGTYALPGLPAGEVIVRFRHPDTNVTWGELPATLSANMTSQVDFPVVSAGVFYDSLSRELVTDVQVSLTDSSGNTLPDVCLLPGQQNQPVGADGAYRFNVQSGADASCPNSATEYQLVVTSLTPQFDIPPSSIIPPEPTPLLVQACAIDPNPNAPCSVQAQANAPLSGQDTTHFLSWIIAQDDDPVANNHIPLDRNAEGSPLAMVSISKQTETATVTIGDLAIYELRLSNLTNVPMFGITVSDNLPAGFQFVDGSQTLVAAGADERIGTADDLVSAIEVSGTDPVTFGPINLPAQGVLAIRYFTRVTTGVTRGEYVNTATPLLGTTAIGEPASAVVQVVGDPIFEQSTIVGKVFHDVNQDGWQDPDEPGLPGIRLATVSGLLIETDAYGRYHIADIDVPRFERGANFILKLDPHTLPEGSRVISENPRVIRITQGLLSRVNFAVALPEQQLRITQQQPRQRIVTTTSRVLRDAIEPVRFESGKSDIPASYLAQLQALLDTYQDRPNLRVRFVGHTDNEPLSARAAAVYTDNQGLSEARAAAVAEVVRSRLGLQADTIESTGRADGEPVASNRTEQGMALNRRVEIEIVYDEQSISEEIVSVDGDIEFVPSSEPETKATEEVVSRRLEPVRFATAEFNLDDDRRSQLDRMLGQFAPANVVSVKVTGHTDTVPIPIWRQSDQYGSNGDLSTQRAQTVAAYVQQQLNLADEQITTLALGASQPVADNNSEFGRLLNRRAEIEIEYRTVVQTERVERFTLEPVLTEQTLRTTANGRLWITEDALGSAPNLDVLALREITVDRQGQLTDAAEFTAFSNYEAFVDHYQLTIYRAQDTDLTTPLAQINRKSIDLLDPFSVTELNTPVLPGEQLAYVLYAYDDQGHEDQTALRLVNVVAENTRDLPAVDPRSLWGQNNLAQQNIPITGSRVRVYGEDLSPGEIVQVNGANTPVNEQGQFVHELHVPIGGQQISVTGINQQQPWQESLTVDDNYTFVVALANLTVGQQNLTGDFEALSSVDDHFDESVFVDGRIALYAKAKIKGKYLLTAQLDSTEDELRNFSDNLRAEDPRRVFRQLDPNRYYTVYGDDSTTVADVDTQGAFYLRLDWDRNQVIWGNFNTGLTDTEYLQFNRSLYGARATHRSQQQTRFGDTKRSITAFGSQAQTAAAHATFRATGGSLYYLQNTDVVEGSEKVWVEVRQRDTQQVVERQDLREGQDYEIDPIQGRIILRAPLSQVVNNRARSIIRTTPLEGDDVFLLVDYEYLPQGFDADNLTYGVRGKAWLGDHVAIGVTNVVDERDNTDFELRGLDVTLKAGRGTYLHAEIAQSDAQQNQDNVLSVDGGLSFSSQNGVGGDDFDGNAFALEGRVNLNELNQALNGDIRAWWKERDAEFSAGRLANGVEVEERGIDFVMQAGAHTEISAGYAELEEETISDSRVARIQAQTRLDRLTIGGELRYEDITRGVTGEDGDAVLAGVRVGYELNEWQTIYGSVQSGIDESGNYESNDLVAVGVNTQFNEHTMFSLEANDGSRGEALIGGVEYSPADNLSFSAQGGFGPGAISQFAGNYRLAEGHELYGSYAVDPDRTNNARNLLTVGQRRDFGNRFGIFTESQFGEDDRYGGVSHAFGIDYTTEQDWVLSSLIQVAENDTTANPFDRTAVSLGAAVSRDDYKFSSRVEYRTDDGPGVDTEQYLVSTSYSRQLSVARRLQALLSLSRTDDRLNGGRDARFVEFDVGYAYRPADNDRWNLLSRYGYFLDLVSEGQSASRPDQRIHLLSTEAVYRLNHRWELGGKLAYKDGELRVTRDSGRFEDFGVALAVLSGRYHLTHKWDGLAEYRWLSDRDGDNRREGALLGVYRHIGGNLKLGVGYNFTDFSDDIKDAEYDNHGWFVDLIGKF